MQSEVKPSKLATRRGCVDPTVRLHLMFGWWFLLAFLTLGIGLEVMHGFKVPWYMELGNPETRRLMWTLAHAHGALFGLLHIAFGTTVFLLPAWKRNLRVLASRCLMAASIMMPAGFFLGGIWIYEGDPGLGILLVPPGGVLLFVAVFLAAQGTYSADDSPVGAAARSANEDTTVTTKEKEQA